MRPWSLPWLGLLVAASVLLWWVLIAFGYMAAAVLLSWR